MESMASISSRLSQDMDHESSTTKQPTTDEQDGIMTEQELIAARRTDRRKLKKQMKKEQKRQELPGYEMSMYNLPKKLLILDLNKVLLYRQRGSMKYIPRPYAIQFLQDMSQRFQLAIWTSMKQRSAGDLLSSVFQQHNIPLLFTWFQNRCTIKKRDPITNNNNHNIIQNRHENHQYDEDIQKSNKRQRTSQSSVDSQITYTHTAGTTTTSSSSSHDQQLQQDVLSTAGLPHRQYASLSIASSMVDDLSKDDPKPIFYKELKRVWSEFRLFDCTNTILLDDTEEKCLFNPKYNCIHPKAFELDIDEREFYCIAHNVPNCFQPALLKEDEELKPQGALWQYLDRIAQSSTSVESVYEQYGPYVSGLINKANVAVFSTSSS